MLIDHVNVRQGTDSDRRFSRGNTLPLVQRPFGMVSFSLQTQGDRGGWFYHPHDRSLEGIRLTHQPSPWMEDYGAVTFLPQKGGVQSERAHRYSSYDPGRAVLTPSWTEVFLLRYSVRMAVAPTQRCGIFRLDFSEEERNRFSIWSDEEQAVWEIDEEKREVHGVLDLTGKHGCGQLKEYVYLKFDCPISRDEDTFRDEQGISPVLLARNAVVRTAISYHSLEQAKRNLEREVGERSLEQIREEGDAVWESCLGKIEVEGREEDKRTFYSCMYRCFLFPQCMYEPGEDGRPFHISMKDGSRKEGVFYTNNGFWDTYRTLYPLFSILIPDKMKEMLQGYINFYKDTGWFPKWLSPGERGTMPGTLIDAVMADAAVKGILEEEQIRTAYEGLKKHATQESGARYVGRLGIKDYMEYGYLPYEAYHESVSNSLDYMYGDFCIAQIGRTLGEETGFFEERSRNYRKLFCREDGFFEPKDRNGRWKPGFSRYAWGNGYCEGGPWQCGVGVCYDMKGWEALFASREKAMELVNQIFTTDPIFEAGEYVGEIHEMSEMAAADFGQCAISNQPSFLLPYYPALLGDIGQTIRIVTDIITKGFSPDVFPGDEDNGSMAAWYVLSSLGIYPKCPGIPEYVRLPLYWESVSLQLEDGSVWRMTKESTAHFDKETSLTRHGDLFTGKEETGIFI